MKTDLTLTTDLNKQISTINTHSLIHEKQILDASLFLDSVSENPGMYIFYDINHQVLYIGKVKNFKKRLQSYFRTKQVNKKTNLMVSQIVSVQIRQTFIESEALILERNLIKKQQPKFNISLKDDKSFPYIRLTDHDQFSRFCFVPIALILENTLDLTLTSPQFLQ